MNLQWLEKASLWLVTDRTACAPRSVAATASLCLAGGVDVVLCRLKDVADPERTLLAGEIRAACREHDTPFVMSHDLKLALKLDATGLQLGAGDVSLAEARAALGPETVLGYSTHSVAEAEQRFAEGADYVFLGPVFPTPAKLKYGAPLGLDVVGPALALGKPVVFIGGIGEGNARLLTQLGARRLAAITALQAAFDPANAARRLQAMLPD